MPHKHIYLYQTICIPNGKIYIGVHETDRIDDGYIGCGISSQSDARYNYEFHKAVRKYGYSNFKKFIVSFYDNYEDALKEERNFVTPEFVKRKDNYNRAIGGRGHTMEWANEDDKNEWKAKIRNSVKKWFENGGLEKRKESAKNAKKIRKFGKDNPMFGNGNKYVERQVIQYDINGNFIKEFKSITEASKQLNISQSSICFCCSGRYKKSKNFIWRYKSYEDKELEVLNENLNKKIDSSISKIKKSNSLRKSFEEKGRKNSIAIRNINTGEILIGITKLNKIYNDITISNISQQLKKKGYFRDWEKFKIS